MSLGEGIESAYLMLKTEQQRLTPKYDIMRSLVPLVKQYNVTIDDNKFNITCQCCNILVTFKGSSGELL